MSKWIQNDTFYAGLLFLLAGLILTGSAILWGTNGKGISVVIVVLILAILCYAFGAALWIAFFHRRDRQKQTDQDAVSRQLSNSETEDWEEEKSEPELASQPVSQQVPTVPAPRKRRKRGWKEQPRESFDPNQVEHHLTSVQPSHQNQSREKQVLDPSIPPTSVHRNKRDRSSWNQSSANVSRSIPKSYPSRQSSSSLHRKRSQEQRRPQSPVGSHPVSSRSSSTSPNQVGKRKSGNLQRKPSMSSSGTVQLKRKRPPQT